MVAGKKYGRIEYARGGTIMPVIHEVADNQAAQQQLAALVAELKHARRRRGDLPQELLAERLDVVANSVADWEAGRDNPSAPHLVEWSRILGLRIAIVDSNGKELPAPVDVDSDPDPGTVADPDADADADGPTADHGSGESYAQHELRRLAVALRTARTDRRLSQTALAMALGVNRRSITRWESAGSYPRPIGFVLWARALECNVHLLPA